VLGFTFADQRPAAAINIARLPNRGQGRVNIKKERGRGRGKEGGTERKRRGVEAAHPQKF